MTADAVVEAHKWVANTKIYVLVSHWDDASVINGLFDSRKLADQYVAYMNAKAHIDGGVLPFPPMPEDDDDPAWSNLYRWWDVTEHDLMGGRVSD